MANSDESANKQRERLRGNIQQLQKIKYISHVSIYVYVYVYIYIYIYIYLIRIMANGDESANKQRERLRGHIQQPQKVVYN